MPSRILFAPFWRLLYVSRIVFAVSHRRSKTDQDAAGTTVAVPFGEEEATCPVRALRAWLDVRGAGAGDVVFGRRSPWEHRRESDPHGIATIVRERAALANVAGDFAAHSLRAGFATSAARAGRTEAAIMRHGRWKSVQVARRYIRQGSRWLDNPVAAIGL